jgi:hypothetical protein
LQKRIEDTLMQMQEDVFAASLGTHKLSGTLEGLRALRLAFLSHEGGKCNEAQAKNY